MISDIIRTYSYRLRLLDEGREMEFICCKETLNLLQTKRGKLPFCKSPGEVYIKNMTATTVQSFSLCAMFRDLWWINL